MRREKPTKSLKYEEFSQDTSGKAKAHLRRGWVSMSGASRRLELKFRAAETKFPSPCVPLPGTVSPGTMLRGLRSKRRKQTN
jgi:hypothetical protein